MADASSPDGLVDRAANLLGLVSKMSAALCAYETPAGGYQDAEIKQEQREGVGAAWSALLPAIVEVGNTLDASDNSPIAGWIREVGRVAQWFNGKVRERGLANVLFDFNCDGFHRIDREGNELLGESLKRMRDPFSFVEQPAEAPALSLLDQFPVTPAGHVGFLERVRSEVHDQALSKRNQRELGYSNQTIENAIRGIKWAEASARLAAITGLPDAVRGSVDEILQRDLTADTVEQIDELLTPAVRSLRDAFEAANRIRNAKVVEPPELVLLRQWFAVDGIKGHWEHNIDSARLWDLDVDVQHRNIAFLLRQHWDGDPSESEIREYLFKSHGLTPSDAMTLNGLEKLLKQALKARESTEPPKSGSQTPKQVPGGWMGDSELAIALGVHSSQVPAFRAKLKRMRDKGELSMDDWQEFENRKRNEPQFLYRANAPAIVAMAKRYSLPK